METRPAKKQSVIVDGKFNQRQFDLNLKERLKKIIDKKPISKIMEFMETEIQNSTELTSFTYNLKCFMTDGAYALYRAVESLEGYSSRKGAGPSDAPPQTLDVKFADGEHIKVPWGNIQLPSLGNDAEFNMAYDKSTRILRITGNCEKRYVELMDNIIDKAQWYLDNESIYKAQAIRLDSDLNPHFLNLESAKDQPIYLKDETKAALTSIYARLERPDWCREHDIDLKFGALMQGPYGTGKTLLAFKLAYTAIKNNWSFFYLTDPTKVSQLLEIAGDLCTNGNGIMIFVEDIDLVITGKRDENMNRIINLMDGGDTKNLPIISIFTTNHPEKIDPTFLRGKRIGKLINMTALDSPTAREFILKTLGDTLKKGETLDTVCEMAESYEVPPSFMHEVLDDVTTRRLMDGRKHVTEKDVIDSLKSYKAQMDVARIQTGDKSDYEKLTELLGKVLVGEQFKETLKELDLIE